MKDKFMKFFSIGVLGFVVWLALMEWDIIPSVCELTNNWNCIIPDV